MQPEKLTILQAFAREEGFYQPYTRAARNHNPGNIEYGRFARAHGAIASDGRFAMFRDDAAGFGCMRALFEGAYKGLTVAEAVAKWAPAGENDVASYTRNVCEWTGLAAGDVIDTHLG